MFDFRYHALSLVAVFLALAVGLLLGVAIGDQGLVSSAEDSLRDDLRSDVERARDESRALREQLQRERRFSELAIPALIGDRLEGRRVAVIFMHGRSAEAFADVQRALQPAGGELAFAGTLREPLDREALAPALEGTRYAGIATDEALVEPFARRAGESLVAGGNLVAGVRRALFSSSSGSLDGAEAVVVVHGQAKDRDAEEPFERAFIEGLGAFDTPVAGVERTDTGPSQIRWYERSGIPTVDNVDQPAGRASLVLALAGSADGDYGVKRTADSYVPDALGDR